MLDGYWTSEKIETAANKAVDNAEYYLGRPAHKMDQASKGEPNNEVPLEELGDNHAKAKADISSGIVRLETLIE